MGNPIMVGCDLHDRSMLLKVAIGDGEPRQMNYQNTPEGRRKMVIHEHDPVASLLAARQPPEQDG